MCAVMEPERGRLLIRLTMAIRNRGVLAWAPYKFNRRGGPLVSGPSLHMSLGRFDGLTLGAAGCPPLAGGSLIRGEINV